MRQKNNTILIIAALLILSVLGVIFLMLPSEKNGWLNGHVADISNGEMIAGVDVTATDENGKEYTAYENIAASGQDGFFSLSLPPGNYTINFKAAGYNNLTTSESFTVEANNSKEVPDPFLLEPSLKEASQQEDEAVRNTDTEPQINNVVESPTVITCDHSINNEDNESYGSNLDPSVYYAYTSNYPLFYFGYPPHLFNSVECSFDPMPTLLGKNIETHTFRGSLGSELSFSLSSRTDGLSLKEAAALLYKNESSEITKKKNDLMSFSDGVPGFVVSGYGDNGMIIYRLVRITSDSVMEMRMVFPPYKNKDDKNQKGYVVDCIYKMCGFSYSENRTPHSYSDYVKGK